jgi:hypothetical protein
MRRQVNSPHGVPRKQSGPLDDTWRLPSGKKLAEFALACGFLAPPLIEKAEKNRGRTSVEKKLS